MKPVTMMPFVYCGTRKCERNPLVLSYIKGVVYIFLTYVLCARHSAYLKIINTFASGRKLSKELKNDTEILVGQMILKLRIKAVRNIVSFNNSRTAWPT